MFFSAHMALVLFTPPLVTIGVCAWLNTPWKLVASLYLLAPLVASIGMVMSFPERNYSMFSPTSIDAVLGIYIMAFFLFGYVPAFLGAFARFLVLAVQRRIRLTRLWLLTGGILVGALFGAAFLVALGSRNKDGPPGDTYHATIILLVSGAMSGGISGLLVALSCPKRDEPDHTGRISARLPTARSG
jgi:hypothetical protein